MMQSRLIMHVDLDAFFASVEILLNPSLKGKAVIVGGDPNKRGVVSTCSYEARRYGVHSAMPLFEAKQLCPHAIFLEGNFSLYSQYSQRVMALLESWTAHLEIVGIDEAYLDVTAVAETFGGAFLLGKKLRQQVYQETGLTCSVGIGSNKLIAKIASGLAKPNGLYEIPAGKERAFLAPLPIEVLPGVGSKTQAILNSDGFNTISQIQALGLEGAVNAYGASGYWFYMASIGKDHRRVEDWVQSPKSIGKEETFEKDVSDIPLLKETLVHLLKNCHRRLIQLQMRARGLSLKLRFSDFTTITRSITLDTHHKAYPLFEEKMLQLFSRVYERGIPLRLIGVTLEKLTDGYWQPTFWDP